MTGIVNNMWAFVGQLGHPHTSRASHFPSALHWFSGDTKPISMVSHQHVPTSSSSWHSAMNLNNSFSQGSPGSGHTESRSPSSVGVASPRNLGQSSPVAGGASGSHMFPFPPTPPKDSTPDAVGTNSSFDYVSDMTGKKLKIWHFF